MSAKHKKPQQAHRPARPKPIEGWEYAAAREKEQGVRSVFAEVEKWLKSLALTTEDSPSNLVDWTRLFVVPTSGSHQVAPKQGADKEGDYVDPILFSEGVYSDQADYESTIDSLAERINNGTLQPRGREAKQAGNKPAIANTPSNANDALREAILGLSPEQRELITLLYFDGLTQKQAAEALDAPLSLVKSRARTALKILSKLIS